MVAGPPKKLTQKFAVAANMTRTPPSSSALIRNRLRVARRTCRPTTVLRIGRAFRAGEGRRIDRPNYATRAGRSKGVAADFPPSPPGRVQPRLARLRRRAVD